MDAAAAGPAAGGSKTSGCASCRKSHLRRKLCLSTRPQKRGSRSASAAASIWCGRPRIIPTPVLLGANRLNIRLWPDDARPLLRALPAASIGRVFILFPDPWPKARHQKRRLVSPETIEELARVMRPRAELRIGTDIGSYATAILQAVQGHRAFIWACESPSDWRLRPEDWPGTRYEAKALAAGRRCYYFRFRRSG
jgi:hypothetical protein